MWRAQSSTATSITGDIVITDTKVGINLSSYTIAKIRTLKQEEAGAVFDADSAQPGNGALYRLSIPAQKKFMHRNTLCGTEDTQWMATFVQGRNLHVAFFSGEKMPVFTPNDIQNSTDFCGTFVYGR